jgi:coenzyme F420 hydrogenase subunit beta
MGKSVENLSIDEVVRWRLCLGCGACAYLSGGALRMVDQPGVGLRPLAEAGNEGQARERPHRYCPALGASAPETSEADPVAARLGLGPVLEVWEGHATDRETRLSGSSGGALTALARFALEGGGMAGVLHVGADPDDPLRNRAVLSRTFPDLLRNTGSRYGPAAVCERLDLVERAGGPCVVIGQPSEVTALRNLERLRPKLKENVGLALSFYCAGSPATSGTASLLRARGVDVDKVEAVRYRGNGWPGLFTARVKDREEPALEMTYADSWAELQAHRPWSTHIWPDGGGEHADISCGDAWHREILPGEAGSSLIVVRTARGRDFLRQAVEAGYLEVEKSDPRKVVKAQQNLMSKKGAVWGRLLAMRFMGLPTPRHRGYRLFREWRRLALGDKFRSLAGTVRRIWSRNYRIPATRGVIVGTERVSR